MKSWISTLAIFLCFSGALSRCPSFYRDYGLQGGFFEQCANGNVGPGWNDQISSFSVPRGYEVTIYQHYGYGGRAVGPYKEGTYNVPADFNDQASSIKISRPNCPILYRDYDQSGPSIQVCSSGNVPGDWNDQVSSVFVPPGFTITLYEHYNFGGNAFATFTEGTNNVPSRWNDQLSSLKVAGPPSYPTFYRDYNFQGGSFQLESSNNVPNGWNDQVSSFYVPAGYSVTLFQDYGYSGPSFGPYSEGSYNVPSQFNDQLSSVKIQSVSFLELQHSKKGVNKAKKVHKK